MHIINDEELSRLIQPDLRDFISLSFAITQVPPEEISKPLIGRLLLEASKCEEMLDAYGALRNKYWSPVRMAAATAKSFSRVVYNLFHLNYSLPHYRLLAVEEGFSEATKAALSTLLCSISTSASGFLKVAKKMKLNRDLRPIDDYGFRDIPVCGRLEANQQRKIVQDPRSMVVSLATSMLNLAEESSWLDIYAKFKASEYHTCIPDLVSEAQLRSLANSFHSLQSRYDTYLSGSDIAESDVMLPGMRDNLTVVFHLLDTAVTLIHFYERHALKNWNKKLCTPLSNVKLLGIIIDYFVAYADKFIMAAQNLCQDILKSYAVQGEIEAPIPNYRGFHVRPSTLIAKIASHYGSEVKMVLGKMEYNAALPLELFRANEELNRRKRGTIVRYLMEHEFIRNDADSILGESQMKTVLRMILFDLLKKQKIMIYNNDYSFEDMMPYEDETLAEFVKRTIARYLAVGKIDIVSGETVLFQGDTRVLEDIKILAESGYGEDEYGNNTVLPPQLSYLKR